MLGLGYRVKNATAPQQLSFSLSLSVIPRLDRFLRICLGSSPPACCSAHHGMSLVSPSLLATCGIISLIRVFPLTTGRSFFFRFPCVLVHYHSPLLGTLCMCSLYASIFLRH
jgi:hypothetical protein